MEKKRGRKTAIVFYFFSFNLAPLWQSGSAVVSREVVEIFVKDKTQNAWADVCFAKVICIVITNTAYLKNVGNFCWLMLIFLIVFYRVHYSWVMRNWNKILLSLLCSARLNWHCYCPVQCYSTMLSYHTFCFQRKAIDLPSEETGIICLSLQELMIIIMFHAEPFQSSSSLIRRDRLI